MQSSYSEAETSSMDSTPCDSFQLSQTDIIGSGSYQSPLLSNSFSTLGVSEQPEKRPNTYMPSSVSMRSVSSTNVVNENLTKRPSSLPVFKQSG